MLHRAKRLVAASLAATLMLAATLAAPATAITDGYPDAEGHPYVGLMVAQDGAGNPMWRCSGTLLTPTVFLTAGHCTDGAAHVEIWFQSDVQSGTPGNGYPYTGQAGGTPYTHPDYPNGPFFHADLGVVVLDAPYVTSAYGAIPTLNQLDALKPGRRTTFTAVGYGLQTSFPDPASFLEHNVKVRMVAHPHLLQINVPGFTGDYSLLLSNNTNTGGTCFGDSGGPNFLGTSNVVAAVTSFGINGNCAGTGGVYRIDRADDLDWLAGFLN